MARIPKYCRHQNGQAYLQYSKKRYYLGKHGSPESRRRYRQFLSRLEGTESSGGGVASMAFDRERSIIELADYYLSKTEPRHSGDGAPSKEFGSITEAIKRLCDVHADTSISDFGPLKLIEVQDYLKSQGLARNYINAQIGRIKRFFRWCAARELMPAVLYHGISAVESLRKGHGGRETEDVRPADPAVVKATLPWLSPVVAAMVRIQWLCGMRPGEVVLMRAKDINCKGDVWLYELERHKNRHRGQRRVVAIPRDAQELLGPFLAAAASRESYLFSPKLSRQWHVQQLRKNRKTKVQPSQANRSKAYPSRCPGEIYTPYSYRRTIYYARKKAAKAGFFIPHWHPHQLRHGIATFISQEFGQQAAQRWLGHANLKTTDIYVERQVEEVIKIAKQLDSVWSW